MTRVTRWALLAGVLALALLVAFLPRTGNAPDGQNSQDLGPARAQAALQACPKPGGGQVRHLAGVPATCLADGSQIDLGAALGGAPALINVWATWCQPCREELPVLEKYAAEQGAVRVLTVQVESAPGDGLELLAELGVHLPAVYDGAGRTGPVRTALRVPRALPASYLVRSDGTVRFVDDPRLFTSVTQVRDAVESAR